MNKEEQVMAFLHDKVFDPILNSKSTSSKAKAGTNLTIARMNKLSAEKMVQYFWTALSTDNAIAFSKLKKDEGLMRFEDVQVEFRDRFNDEWIRK